MKTTASYFFVTRHNKELINEIIGNQALDINYRPQRETVILASQRHAP
jgi:hypothetical protein